MKPGSWRARAEELRDLAARTYDPDARRQLRSLAETWDDMALRFERQELAESGRS